MNNLGMGVMIGMLGGNNETVESVQKSLNKHISNIKIATEDDENKLILEFSDSSKLYLWDDGQSCCESRYMTTDDDLKSFEDSVFLNVEIRDAPNVKEENEDEYDWGEEHEVQFLLITTSKGVFTLETHNEHNGYYSGFWIVAKIK